MKNFTSVLLFLLSLLGLQIGYGQSTGNLDLTFHSDGKLVTDNGFLDLYQDVEVQPDGKIIAVGTYYDAIYSASIQVARLLEDGSYDPTFGDNGIVTYHKNYETGAYACHLLDNGDILVAGITTDDLGAFAIIVLKFNEYGILDPLFGSSGTSYIDLGPGEDIAYAMDIQEDGKILIAGYSNNENYLNEPIVLRLTENGELDASFGENGVATLPVTEMDNDFSTLAIQSDGNIIAAGHISNGLSWFSLLAARFDPTGNLDTTFATGGIFNMDLNHVDDEFFALQSLENDDLILTGFTTIAGNYDYYLLLMKLDKYGIPVTSFGNNGSVIISSNPYVVGNALVIQPDGKIIVAGTAGEKMPMNNDWALWRFNEDGSPDPTFGTSGLTLTEFYEEPDEARAVTLTGDKIVVAGKARNGSQNFNFAIARYLNDINVSVAEPLSAGTCSFAPNPVKQGGTIQFLNGEPSSLPLRIEIINMAGQVLVSHTFLSSTNQAGENRYSLPGFLAPGIYLLRELSPSGSVSRKMVITN